MTIPDLPDHRRYLNRIDTARIGVVLAFAVCGIGYALCVSYVHEQTWASGYRGSKAWLWAIQAFGVGTVACLLAVVGLIGESLLRAWNACPLSRWELAFAVPCGLLACVTPLAVIDFGRLLCDNVAFVSLVGVLAIGIAICLVLIIAFGVLVVARHRQGRSAARSSRMAAALLGLAGCVMFAVFIPLRAAEGRKQHEIVVALEAMTHHVHYDYMIESDGHAVISKGRPDSWVPGCLLSMAGVDFFHRVVRVDLESSDPDLVAVLPHLQGLSSLKYVVLSTEVPANKRSQIEQALPSCRIRYTSSRGAKCLATDR